MNIHPCPTLETGWTNIGNLASEVRNPKRSYPIGAAVACVLVMLNYVYPVSEFETASDVADSWFAAGRVWLWHARVTALSTPAAARIA